MCKGVKKNNFTFFIDYEEFKSLIMKLNREKKL